MEIVYCAGCQSRVTGAEIDRGRAFRSGDGVLCADCAPEELTAPRPESSPRPRAPASTRRAASPESPRRNPLVWVSIAVVAAVVLLALLLLPGGPPPRPPEPVAAPAPRPAEKPPDRSASEWTALEKRVAESCDREEFGTAVSALEGARRSASESDWNRLVDRRLAEVRARIDGLFQDLKSRPRSPDLVARVSKWGLSGYSLEEKPAPPPPPPPPAPAPAPAPPAGALVVYDDRLAPGWGDWSYSAKRTWDVKDPVAEGSNSLQVVYERTGAGLYLHSGKPIDAARYAAVEFYCRSEGESQPLFLSLSDENKKTIASVSFAKFGGHPPVGSWKHYEVPMSTLNPDLRRISGLTIQASGKVTPNPVYFDAILFRPAP